MESKLGFTKKRSYLILLLDPRILLQKIWKVATSPLLLPPLAGIHSIYNFYFW